VIDTSRVPTAQAGTLYEQITMSAILLAAVGLDAWARTLRGG
jgi:hypothetical protein